MTTEPLFWCVWNERGGSPTVKHPTFATAKREAERLARSNPGQRFVVLAAALAYVRDDLREVRFTARGDHPDGCMCLDCEVPF